MTKISQLTDIGANLAAGDEFLIRDVSDASTPNKKVTSSGFVDYIIAQGTGAGFTQIAAGVGPLARALASSSGATGTLAFSTASATTLIERARIDSSGRLLVGTSTTRSNLFAGNAALPAYHLVEGGNDNGRRTSAFVYGAGSNSGPILVLAAHASNSAGGITAVTNGWEVGTIDFQGSDGTNFVPAARIAGLVDGTPGANDMPGRLVFSTTADGAASPTERMRINSTGFISIGGDTDTGFSNPSANNLAITTGGTERILFTNDAYILFNGITNKALRDSTDSTGGNGLSIDSGVGGLLQIATSGPTFFNRTGSNGELIAFRRAGAPVGGISVTASATSYATSSDYRLKENVVALTGAIDRINDLRVCRFNFIANPDQRVDGFLAHEAQAIVPECVTGKKDEVDDDGNPVYQGIDQSKLVPLLTAALQEAIAKIEALEIRLSALETA